MNALKKIASETGGKYFPAADAAQLSLIFGELADELQTTYTVTFPSRNPSHDGTARGIDISIVRDGQTISNVAQTEYGVHGVVVAQRNGAIYLTLLAMLCGLLLVPIGIRKMYRASAGRERDSFPQCPSLTRQRRVLIHTSLTRQLGLSHQTQFHPSPQQPFDDGLWCSRPSLLVFNLSLPRGLIRRLHPAASRYRPLVIEDKHLMRRASAASMANRRI